MDMRQTAIRGAQWTEAEHDSRLASAMNIICRGRGLDSFGKPSYGCYFSDLQVSVLHQDHYLACARSSDLAKNFRTFLSSLPPPSFMR